jgi:septum site-determining protein MinC
MKRRRHVVIKGSSLPVLRIVVRDGDAGALRAELADTIESARPLLSEGIAVLDLREREASESGAGEIVDAVREASVRLAAVLVGEPNARGPLADCGVPVIEVPLSTRDRPGPGAIEEQAAASGPEADPIGQPAAPTSAQDAADLPAQADLAPAYLTRPLRSGQRFYAQGRDVVVTAPTSRGSELIADGSVYAFSPIRGRVLAGASGNASACIVASHLDAELVAVAGVYRIFEADDLQALGTGPVSVALSLDADGSERITLAALAPSSSMQRR